jgi:hypothetical protein
MSQSPSEHRTRTYDPPARESTRVVPVSYRRAIQIDGAREIIVRPRIPAEYKAMIWFSFGLNVLLLLLLLGGGLWAINRLRATEAAIDAAINAQSPAGQRFAELRRDPEEAVETARWTVGELQAAIDGMHSAHIRTTIPIDQRIPIELTVPVSQQTTVLTTAPVPMVVPATFTFPGGGGQINGSVALSLPPGLELPVDLALTIPISESVPVQFDVPVDIAVADTELGDDFERLQQLIQPAAELLRAE